MKKNFQQYVGHNVRLSKRVFEKVARQAARLGEPLENCFLVGAVNRRLGALVCYAGNMCVTVPAAEAVLV